MSVYKVVGYNILIDVKEKQAEIVNENGIIIASDKGQHIIMSGEVLELGHMIRRDCPDLDIGDTVYFYDMDYKRMRVDNNTFGIIHLDNVKIVKRKGA